MPLSCQACNQSLYPGLQTCYETASSKLRTHANIHNPDSTLFSTMAKDLAPYVESLKKELKAASDALEAALALSAPIHDIPDEILLNVFEHLSLEPFFQHDVGCYDLKQLLEPSFVCKRWHNIITSTPKFWKTILVPDELESYFRGPDDLQTPSVELRTFLHSTRAQVARAGHLPLVLKNNSAISEPVLDVLNPYFHRITSIEIGVFGSAAATGLFDCLSLMPNLSHLSANIECGNPNHEPPDFSIILPRQQVSKLTCIKLRVEPRLHRLSVPLAQLNTFRLTLCYGADFNPSIMIGELTRIESLELDLNIDYEVSQPPIDWIGLTLPYLRSLTLRGRADFDIPLLFLQTSHLPLLQTFKIDVPSTTKHFLADVLRIHQLWTVTKLSLRLHGEATTRVEFHNILQHFRTLHTLRFDTGNDPDVADSVLRAMVLDTDEILFPQLKSLVLERVHYHGQAINLLQRMVRKRMSSIDVPFRQRKALRTVIIKYTLYSVWEHSQPYTCYNPWETVQPPQYNDNITSLKISGTFPTDLEEELVPTRDRLLSF